MIGIYLSAIIIFTLVNRTIKSFIIACVVMSFLLLICNVFTKVFIKKYRKIRDYVGELSLLFLILVCIYLYTI